jgi:hypothetical protein
MSTILIEKTASDLDDFVALSAILTGIAAGNLRPQLDTHGTAATYLQLVQSRAAAAFGTLLSTYRANKSKSAQEIGTLILTQSGAAVANVAKSITLLWYLASWYDPAKLPDTSRFTVVSSDAYTQGWVWRVGQTHPMGYSTWRFGYWHQAPPTLQDFIGGGSGQ